MDNHAENNESYTTVEFPIWNVGHYCVVFFPVVVVLLALLGAQALNVL